MKRTLFTALTLLLVVNLSTAQSKETKEERNEREFREDYPNIIEVTELPYAQYNYVHVIQGHDFVTFDYEKSQKETIHSPGCRACTKPAAIDLFRPKRLPELPNLGMK